MNSDNSESNAVVKSASTSLANKRREQFAKRSVSSNSILSAHYLANEKEPSTNKNTTTQENQQTSGLKNEPSAGTNNFTNMGSDAVFKHLHRHASSLGLKIRSTTTSEDSGSIHDISEINFAEHASRQSATSLSWKKLHFMRPKLKTASSTSALMAGFAMAAIVELQVSTQQIGELPAPLLVIFAVCTSLLVAVHMLVLLITTCILPSMDGIYTMHAINLVHESPHERLHRFIEFAWICSTILGIFLFMLEVTIVCWVQFYNVLVSAAVAATIVFVVFVFIFVWFAITFYRNIITHTYENRQSGIQELEQMHMDMQKA